MPEPRYGHEKAMKEPGVAFVGPLEYVTDREFKEGHPPRRLYVEEAAARLNELESDRLRLEKVGRLIAGANDQHPIAITLFRKFLKLVERNDIRVAIDAIEGIPEPENPNA